MPVRKATPAGPVRMEGGQPVRRFVKELIRCGHYVKDSDEIRFDVTPETIRHWVATCSAYLSAGNKIPVPATHTDDPEANRGWVVDVFAEGESLYGVVDLVGEEGIRLAGTCDTSIYSPAECVDGKGNRYLRPIVHVALCTDPVIPGLAGFVPIQASQDKQKPACVPVLKLREPRTMPSDPMNPMPVQPGQAEPVHAEQPPVTASPSEAIDEAAAQQLVEIFRDDSMDPKSKLKALGDLMKKHAKIRALLGEDDEEEDPSEPGGMCHSAKLSRSAGRVPDPMLVKLAAENYGMKLDGLVAARKISPAVAKRLAAQYIGPNGQELALSLSQGPRGAAHLDGLILALNENTIVPETGEKSGPQTLVLSNPYKAAENDPETKQAIEFMYDQVGAKPAK